MKPVASGDTPELISTKTYKLINLLPTDKQQGSQEQLTIDGSTLTGPHKISIMHIFRGLFIYLFIFISKIVYLVCVWDELNFPAYLHFQFIFATSHGSHCIF